MLYTCKLQQIEFYAYHGLHAEEQLTGGKFLVDVSVTAEREESDQMNQLRNLVNYQDLFEMVSAIMKDREDLMETVAKKIIDHVYKKYNNLHLVEVTITKENPAGLFKSGSAVVKLQR